jgi:hypothetical protein
MNNRVLHLRADGVDRARFPDACIFSALQVLKIPEGGVASASYGLANAKCDALISDFETPMTWPLAGRIPPALVPGGW